MPDESRALTLLEDASAYPFRGHGWVMLVIGSIISAGSTLGYSWALTGISVALVSGYFLAYYSAIIESTVSGRDEPPDFPEISDYSEDILRPALRSTEVLLIAFLPLIVLRFCVLDIDANEDALLGMPLAWVFLAWGAFYFPMASIKTVVETDLYAALPHRVLPDILRHLRAYLPLVGMIAGMVVLSSLADWMGASMPLIGWIFAGGVSFYLMMVHARLGGMFYRDCLEREVDEAEVAVDVMPAAPVHVEPAPEVASQEPARDWMAPAEVKRVTVPPPAASMRPRKD